MTVSKNDRNFVIVGNQYRDDDEWDRLDDKLATGTGVGTYFVPGTYVPKIGLPPGVPYIWVVGNPTASYPINTALAVPLGNDSRISIDYANQLGMGSDAVLGTSNIYTTPEGVEYKNLCVYSPPAPPLLVEGLTYMQFGGRYFSTGAGLFGATLAGNWVWDGDEWVQVMPPTGYTSLAVGRTADNAGIFGLYRLTDSPSPGAGLAIVRTDSFGQTVIPVDGFEPLPPPVESPDQVNLVSILVWSVDVGWIQVRVVYYHEDEVGNPIVDMTANKVIHESGIGGWAGVPTTPNNSALDGATGVSGIHWSYLVAADLDPYGSPIPNTERLRYLTRTDFTTASAEVFMHTIEHPSAGYRFIAGTIKYISDNVCVLGGYAVNTDAGFTSRPFLMFAAIDALGDASYNLLDFPEFEEPGLLTQVTDVVVVGDGSIVFNIQQGAGYTVNYLYRITVELP